MRDGRTFLSIGAVSALLAAFVPGVFDTARPVPAPIVVGASFAASGLAEQGSATVDLALTKQSEAPTLPREEEGAAKFTPSTPIPPGCERLVSSLTRSAASRAVGRCIT